MSAWSNKPFGNDAALDWLSDPQLQNANEYLLTIHNTVRCILENWDGDSEEAQRAIAAIAVVAAAAVDPIGQCHKESKALITKHGFVPSASLITDCQAALKLVCDEAHSELRELWIEEDSLDAWLKQNKKLTDSLTAALQNGLPARTPKQQALPRSLYKLISRYKAEPTNAIRKKIAQKFAEIPDVNRGSTDTDFLTPLYLAASHGFFEEAQSLLNRGADPNGDGKRFFGPSGNYPFDVACVSGNLDLAELLRNCGAQIFSLVEARSPDIDGRVISVGGEPMRSGSRYWRALIRVAAEGSVDALEYLLSQGATLHERDWSGQGIVHWAAEGGNVHMLIYLAKLGLDLDKPVGVRGPTPLCKSVSSLQLEATRFLLEKGVNPNHVNRIYCNHPETPMDRALTNANSRAIAELLKSYGAKTLEELETRSAEQE
jgi:ankyrin repeat protein